MSELTIWKWTRTKTYTKHPRDVIYTDVSYIPTEWMEVKIGEDELRFWRVFDATVEVVHNDDGTVTFTNISPDNEEMVSELFEPIDISALDDGTHDDAIEVLPECRQLHYEMHDGHVIVWIEHDDISASFDLDDVKWVDMARAVY